jgi:hypothetical protein
MKIRLALLMILLTVLPFTSGCSLFSNDPCDKVYFDGSDLVVPNCDAYSLLNPKLDENKKLIYFEFKVVCSNTLYNGSVSLIRDAAGKVIDKTIIVNGKTCK